jgi:hypothetical protein
MILIIYHLFGENWLICNVLSPGSTNVVSIKTYKDVNLLKMVPWIFNLGQKGNNLMYYKLLIEL